MGRTPYKPGSITGRKLAASGRSLVADPKPADIPDNELERQELRDCVFAKYDEVAVLSGEHASDLLCRVMWIGHRRGVLSLGLIRQTREGKWPGRGEQEGLIYTAADEVVKRTAGSTEYE